MSEEKGSMRLAKDLLEDALKEYVPLQEWLKPLKDGQTFQEPWLIRTVDPVHINFATRDLQIGFLISSHSGQARVVLEIPVRLWEAGLQRKMVAAAADRAMKLCDYCWNNHMLSIEGAYPKVVMTIDAV